MLRTSRAKNSRNTTLVFGLWIGKCSEHSFGLAQTPGQKCSKHFFSMRVGSDILDNAVKFVRLLNKILLQTMSLDVEANFQRQCFVKMSSDVGPALNDIYNQSMKVHLQS